MNRSAQERTISAIDSLLRFFKTRQKPLGLGLKKVYKNYWEIRLDIKNRIIFEFNADMVNFAFVGDHDGVRKFLKNV